MAVFTKIVLEFRVKKAAGVYLAVTDGRPAANHLEIG
jgi:hypothetical protein